MAKEWKEDAYLVSAETYIGTGNADEYQLSSFSFRSRSTQVIGLLVWYDPVKDSFWDEWLSIAKESPGRKSEILDSDWRIDSIEALEIAQAHGGSKFLTGRSGRNLHLYLRLEKQQRGEQLLTVWLAAYYDREAARNLRVAIDALTGEVVEISGTQ